MVPILLLILKIIGIVMLVLLGLLLSALFLVLLVPIRYSLSGSFYGKPKGQVRVTWLFHAISIGVTYEEGMDIALRILGKRQFQKKAGKEKAEEKLKDGLAESGENLTEIAEETYELIDDSRSTDGDLTEEWEEFCSSDERKSTRKKNSKQHGKKRSDPRNTSSDKKPSIVEHLKQTADSWKEKWDQLEGYKDKISAFWKDEKNQKTLRLIIRQIKAIVIHVLPRKARGKAVFGFDDPGTTGKALEALSLVYVWYGDSVEIVPVFDRKIFEAEGSLKGRVRIGTIAARGFRILLNKNFRMLVKRWLKNGGR